MPSASPTGELNERADQLAGRLVELGIGPDRLVGVSMQPSIDRLVAVLAILKAGGGYLPLDPSLPAQRLSFMLLDAAVPVVITDQASLPSLPATDAVLLQVADAQGGPPAASKARGDRFEHRVCHLHLRIHRPAQGRRGRAPERGELRPRPTGLLAARHRRPGVAVLVVELRRVRARNLHRAVCGGDAGADEPGDEAVAAAARRPDAGAAGQLRLPVTGDAQRARRSGIPRATRADLGRRGAPIGVGDELAAARPATVQRIRSHRGHGAVGIHRDRCRSAAAADRPAAGQLPGVRARSDAEPGAARGDRRAARRRRRGHPRLSEPAGADGRPVHLRSVQPAAAGPPVQDR